jgi:ubiquinone biosynthesis monooxygenase Coq7
MTSSETIVTGEERARMLRVNHAGEYGARRIYAGQLAVLKGRQGEDIIRHMAEQEDAHFEAFDSMLRERRVRPTALMPLWHAAGFALGAVTARLGREAAMACTVAVESVIDGHYAAQETRLQGGADDALHTKITQFRKEEREHHDIGLEQGAQSAPLYPVLSFAVKSASRLAIWLSTRI